MTVDLDFSTVYETKLSQKVLQNLCKRKRAANRWTVKNVAARPRPRTLPARAEMARQSCLLPNPPSTSRPGCVGRETRMWRRFWRSSICPRRRVRCFTHAYTHSETGYPCIRTITRWWHPPFPSKNFPKFSRAFRLANTKKAVPCSPSPSFMGRRGIFPTRWNIFLRAIPICIVRLVMQVFVKIVFSNHWSPMSQMWIFQLRESSDGMPQK